MDTHDVSGVSEYMQLLQKQKQTLQRAQSRKGQSLKLAKSRDDVIMQFLFHRMIASNKPVGMYQMHSSFVPPAYPPSVASLDNLRKILIRDLTLETHHRGSYILLRAVTPTDKMTAIIAVVEDESGDVITLQLYNQDDDLATDGRLVEGTVICLKEPYLKLMADGNYGLRVDHLSDVRLLPDYDHLVPPLWRRRPRDGASTSSWKARGNDFFNQAKYHSAIDCYSKALDSSPTAEEALALRLNRALTCLKTYQFDSALRDLDLVLASYGLSEKALFRKSQALYYLRRFQESYEVHQVLSREYPGNTIAKKESERATARVAVQQSGKYPFKQLQLAANKLRPPLLDRATYVGPVSVELTESRGRGLFTTEAVRAGDLLFCEKAFAHAFQDEDNGSSGSLSILLEAETDTITIGTQAKLISLIAQKLYKNPSLMSAFSDLYHGSYTPVGVTEVDGLPIVDTFLIARTTLLNCFGCPLSSRAYHVRHMDEGEAQQLEISDEYFHSSGIWILASYINHSCCANVHRSFIGDMMIVRAAQDLPANTELTFCYRKPLDSVSTDKQLDLRHWGFKCTCVICLDRCETNVRDLKQRKKISEDLLKTLRAFSHSKNQRAFIAKAEGLVSMLEKTYRRPCSEIPRVGIWRVYFDLAAAYATSNQPQNSIGFAFKAFESLGFIIEGGQLPHTPGTRLLVRKWGLMNNGLVSCWMMLYSVYLDVEPELAPQAEDYARITYKICVGEDETFSDAYSRFYHHNGSRSN